MAGELPEGLPGNAARDRPRPCLPRQDGQPDRRAVQPPPHRLQGQLLALPDGEGEAPGGPEEADGPAAGGDQEDAGVHRAVPLQGHQGQAGPEPRPHAGAVRGRGARTGGAAGPHPLPRGAEERPGGGGPAPGVEDLRGPDRFPGSGPDRPPGREDRPGRRQRGGKIDPGADSQRHGSAFRRRSPPRAEREPGLLFPGERREPRLPADRLGRDPARGNPQQRSGKAESAGRLSLFRRRRLQGDRGSLGRGKIPPGPPENPAPGLEPADPGRADQSPGPEDPGHLPGRPARLHRDGGHRVP